MTTIKVIQAALQAVSDLSDPIFSDLAHDKRSGVQLALKKRKKELMDLQIEEERLEAMLSYEKRLNGQGITLIAGIDEVGRGPLAGPVVAAAVILPQECKIIGLNDSKKIPKSKHLSVYQDVLDKALSVGIGIKDQTIIDQVNIYEATKLAMLEALEQLSVKPEHLLIDAMTLETSIPQTSIIKGDANSLSIAAASIVAKVTRDKMMADYDRTYTGYHFAKNAGYGTKEHLQAIEQLGISPIHRLSFEPIKSLVNKRH